MTKNNLKYVYISLIKNVFWGSGVLCWWLESTCGEGDTTITIMSKDIKPLVKAFPFQFLLFTSKAVDSEFLYLWRYIIAADVFSSVQFSRSFMSNSLRPHELQHARLPCTSPTPRVHPNLCPSSWWCHPAISSSVIPFSSCPQSFPASGSFQISQLFTSGGQSWCFTK